MRSDIKSVIFNIFICFLL